MTLTEFPEVQEKCHEEITACLEKHGEIIKEHCPYTHSVGQNVKKERKKTFWKVLMENMRWHPVADSLPHYASEDVEIGGVTIPKNAPIQGLLRLKFTD